MSRLIEIILKINFKFAIKLKKENRSKREMKVGETVYGIKEKQATDEGNIKGREKERKEKKKINRI